MTAPKPRVGVYPGTFDPITKGHSDVIRRALAVVDLLIIGIAEDNTKSPIFTPEERRDLVSEEVKEFNVGGQTRVVAHAFSGLLVDFVKSQNASLIIRGLRAVSDFEYEFQMSCMNSKLVPSIETVFIPASDRTQFISSRFVKEVARLGGDISQFVSPSVETKLKAFYAK